MNKKKKPIKEINIEFSIDDITALEKYRDQQTDHRLRLRFMAILMVANGVSIQQTASIIGKNPKSVKNWLTKYATRGIDSLNYFQYVKKKLT